MRLKCNQWEILIRTNWTLLYTIWAKSYPKRKWKEPHNILNATNIDKYGEWEQFNRFTRVSAPKMQLIILQFKAFPNPFHFRRHLTPTEPINHSIPMTLTDSSQHPEASSNLCLTTWCSYTALTHMYMRFSPYCRPKSGNEAIIFYINLNAKVSICGSSIKVNSQLNEPNKV